MLINDEDLLYVFITNLGANKVGPLMNKVLYTCTATVLRLLYNYSIPYYAIIHDWDTLQSGAWHV